MIVAFAGLLTSLTIAFPRIGVLEWLSLVPAALVLYYYANQERVNYFDVFLSGAAFFLPFYLVITSGFLYMYPLDFINGMTEKTALMIVLLAWLVISVFHAALGGVFFIIAAFLFRSAPVRRLPLLRPFAAASLWVIYEWIQTFDWWGMPNCRLALGQTRLEIGIQSASLFGSYLVSFIIVAVNFFFAYAVSAMQNKETEGKGRAIKLSALLATALLVFNYGAGSILWFTNSPDSKNESIKVVAVQANIPMTDLHGREVREIYRKYTLEAAGKGADVVVWAETALPNDIEAVEGFISEVAAEANVTVVTGVFTSGENGEQYNSVVCFTSDGELCADVYEKRHLVPFGEFIPLKSFINKFFPYLADLATLGSDLSVGEGSTVIVTDNGRFGAGVCYDVAYEDITLDGARGGAQYFCVSSNAAWFDDSIFLALYNAQSKLRSVECGRYSVYAANTGISSVINHRGEILEELEPLVGGTVSGDVELRNNRTLYSYVGNLLVYICLAAVILLCVFQTVYAIVEKVKANNNLKKS